MRTLYATYLLALGGLLATFTAQAQHLQAIGVAGSFNISQSQVREPGLQLGSYYLQPATRRPRLDDTGNRLSVYARVGLGKGHYFAQPELAYTSTLSSKYTLSYPGDPGPASAPDYESASSASFGYRMRRAELAALVGRHFSSHFYVLAGPVLAWQHQQSATGTSGTAAVYRSLYSAVVPVQLLGQVGLGLQAGRLDLGLRYEHSLTPYTSQVTYQGQTQDFRQHTSQVIFSVGALLCKK